MKRFKKKDLREASAKTKKKADDNKEVIDELVDAEGSPISGDRNAVSDSEIETAPQQTTDDFVQSGIQPNIDFFGYGGTPYSRGRLYAVESLKAKAIIERILKENKNK
jgi:hypothetical protein